MRVLFCGNGWLSIVDRIVAASPDGTSITIREMDVPLVEQVAGYDVLLPSNGSVDANVIAAAGSRLRLIQQPAAGYEGVDLEAAKAAGVPVCNAPGQNTGAVAEAALMLMLMLARRVPEAQRSFVDGVVGLPVGAELSGKTLGVVGLGRSGKRLAELAGSLGMRVLSVRSSDRRAGLLHMLGSCDYVSLHVPLSERTRGLMDTEAFRAMKPGARLINCARGGVVDQRALQDALEDGRLGGVGLDVHWQEPADATAALYRRDDVVALPHVAGSTEESFTRLVAVVVENIRRLAEGEELLHRVA